MPKLGIRLGCAIIDMHYLHILSISYVPQFLEFIEGVDEGPDLAVDVANQFLDLPLGVELLDGLCVGIVADTKRPRNSRGKITKTISMRRNDTFATYIIFCLASSKLSVTK